MPAFVVRSRRLPVRFILTLLLAAAVIGLPACSKGEKPEPVDPAPAAPPPPPPKPKPPAGGGDAGTSLNPLNGLLGTGPMDDKTKTKLLEKYKAALVGRWRADLGNGHAEEVTYTADGIFAGNASGPVPATATGKYTVLQLVGTKGLRIRIEGSNPRTVTVNFLGDEIEHPSFQKGITSTFRKQ